MEDLLHYFSHLALPVVLAWLFFRSDWKRAALVMLLTMVVDLDHLLATPVFDPDRCQVPRGGRRAGGKHRYRYGGRGDDTPADQ